MAKLKRWNIYIKQCVFFIPIMIQLCIYFKSAFGEDFLNSKTVWTKSVKPASLPSKHEATGYFDVVRVGNTSIFEGEVLERKAKSDAPLVKPCRSCDEDTVIMLHWLGTIPIQINHCEDPVFTEQKEPSYSQIKKSLKRYIGKRISFTGTWITGEVSVERLGLYKSAIGFIGRNWVRLLDPSKIKIISDKGYPPNYFEEKEVKFTGKVVDMNITPILVDGPPIIEVQDSKNKIFPVETPVVKVRDGEGKPLFMYVPGMRCPDDQLPIVDEVKYGDMVEVFGFHYLDMHRNPHIILECGKNHYLKLKK